MLVPRCGPAEEGATGGAVEVGPRLSPLNLVPSKVAAGGEPSPIAPMFPTTDHAVSFLVSSQIASIRDVFRNRFRNGGLNQLMRIFALPLQLV